MVVAAARAVLVIVCVTMIAMRAVAMTVIVAMVATRAVHVRCGGGRHSDADGLAAGSRRAGLGCVIVVVRMIM